MLSSFDNHHWDDESDSTSKTIHKTSEATCDSFITVVGESTQHGVDLSRKQSKLLTSDVGPRTRTVHDHPVAPQMSSVAVRACPKEAISATKNYKHGRGKFPPATERPVIFSKHNSMKRRKVGTASPQLIKYTIKDLVSEAQIHSKDIPPYVSTLNIFGGSQMNFT